LLPEPGEIRQRLRGSTEDSNRTNETHEWQKDAFHVGSLVAKAHCNLKAPRVRSVGEPTVRARRPEVRGGDKDDGRRGRGCCRVRGGGRGGGGVGFGSRYAR